MKAAKKLYLNFFLVVYALYAYLDKGAAYTYLAEVLWVLGIALVLLNFRSFEFAWDRRTVLLLAFLLITAIYIVRGLQQYEWLDVTRDAFMFFYCIFAFIVFLFKDELDYFKEKLFLIYKWYPLVQSVIFLLSSYFPFFETIVIHEDITIFSHKYNNISTHLLIASLFYLRGYIKVSKKWLLVNTILIAYLFLVCASYTRAGMLGFVLSLGMFIYFTTDAETRRLYWSKLKYLPLVLLLALPFYLGTHLEENFQGRKLSLEQLKDNAVTIFYSSDKDESLNDNKIWRMVWWGKIIGYTFGGDYFWFGKGLGINLATDADIVTSYVELRSPHNFYLTVLGRFGVPVFFVWLYWNYLQFSQAKRFKRDSFAFVLMIISFMFLFNAALDVYLEGPMAAFPFWTLIGLGYAEEAFKNPFKDTTA